MKWVKNELISREIFRSILGKFFTTISLIYWHLFFLIFHKSKYKIVILSDCPGASMRYRASNLQEILSNHAIHANVYRIDFIFSSFFIKKYNVIIFHRVKMSQIIQEIIIYAKKKNKKLIFDADDLIFDPEFIPFFSAYKKLNPAAQRYIEDLFYRCKLTLNSCDYAIGSTDIIHDELIKRGKKTLLLENSLNKKIVKISEDAFAQKKEHDQYIRLIYVSGSNTHDNDFDTITFPLLTIMGQYPFVKIIIIGFLEINPLLESFKERINFIPFCNWKKLPYEIIKADINLSPLEKNLFCEAKSNIKYLEAGILRIPTVASNIGAFKKHIINGQNGFLCSNHQEWIKTLSLLIENKNLRISIGLNAYYDISLNHLTNRINIPSEIIDDFFN